MLMPKYLLNILIFLLVVLITAESNSNKPSNNLELPLHNSDFLHIRNTSRIYVDKTRYISRLLQQGSKYFFLWRPRRFGKSVFLQTLQCFFKGGDEAKKLFAGTHIYKEENNWETYPILYFDFSTVVTDTAETFEYDLKYIMMMRMFEECSIHLGEEQRKRLFKECFTTVLAQLIRDLSDLNRKPIIILIDEYDAPVTRKIEDVANANMEVTRKFFQVLQHADAYIKLVFITGINKYLAWDGDSKNICDISQLAEFAGITGFSEAELQSYFKHHIEKLANTKAKPRQYIEDVIKDRYSGYRFAEGAEHVYNPISAIRYLETGDIQNYWTNLGVPKCVYEVFRTYEKNISHFQHCKVPRDAFRMSKSNQSEKISSAVCLFHSGYLTIDGYDKATDSYILKFPNEEIRQTFQHLAIKGEKELENDHIKKTEEDCNSLRNSLFEQDLKGIVQSTNNLTLGHGSDRSKKKFKIQDYYLMIRDIWTACGIHTTYRQQITYGQNSTQIEYLDTNIPGLNKDCFIHLKLGESAATSFTQLVDYVRDPQVDHSLKEREIVTIGMNINSRLCVLDSASTQSWKSGKATSLQDNFFLHDPIKAPKG